MTIEVTFYRDAKNSDGDDYKSPLMSFKMKGETNVQHAISQAKRMLCEEFNADDWQDVAHYHEEIVS